jgi:hypothetical protein
MFDDSIIMAFIEIKDQLKEKYPDKGTRIFLVSIIIAVTLTPVFLFDYWIGRISGLILVILFYLYLGLVKK